MAVSPVGSSRPCGSGHHTARQVISILIADYAMIRIAAIVAGLVLIACPAVWLAGITIPVPMYRTHGFADFLFLGQTLLFCSVSRCIGCTQDEVANHCFRLEYSRRACTGCWLPVSY